MSSRISLCVALLALVAAAGCRVPVAWSPDGRQLALETQGRLHLFQVQSSRFSYVDHGDRRAFNPAWSPDGRRLAYFLATLRQPDSDHISEVSLVTLDMTTYHQGVVVPEVGLLAPEAGGFMTNNLLFLRESLNAAWSPDGSRIAYVDQEGQNTVLRVVAASGGEPRRLTPRERNASLPAWSPDGERIAYLSATAAPADPTDLPAAPPERALHVARADGSGDRRLWASPRDRTLSEHAGPQWSPDGERLGVLVEDLPSLESPGMVEECEAWLIPAGEEGEPERLAQVPGPSAFVSFSTDLRTLTLLSRPDRGETDPWVSLLTAPYEAPRQLFKVEVEAAQTPRRLPLPGQERDADLLPVPALSPDGRWVSVLLAPRGQPARLLLIPTAGGEPRRFEVPPPARR